jgi:hypothetical protein
LRPPLAATSSPLSSSARKFAGSLVSGSSIAERTARVGKAEQHDAVGPSAARELFERGADRRCGARPSPPARAPARLRVVLPSPFLSFGLPAELTTTVCWGSPDLQELVGDRQQGSHAPASPSLVGARPSKSRIRGSAPATSGPTGKPGHLIGARVALSVLALMSPQSVRVRTPHRQPKGPPVRLLSLILQPELHAAAKGCKDAALIPS